MRCSAGGRYVTFQGQVMWGSEVVKGYGIDKVSTVQVMRGGRVHEHKKHDRGERRSDTQQDGSGWQKHEPLQ